MNAFVDGWRRVLRAPAVTSGLLVGTLLIAMTTIPGRTNGSLLQGVTWIFAHEVFGFGGILIMTSAMVVVWAYPPVFLWILGSVAFWMFISGGILDRLARDRPTRTAAFFAASGVHFFRFLRLDALMAVFPWLLHRWAGGELQQSPVLLAAVVLALAIWSLIGDYAKTRIVIEDRHSAIGALLGSVRFIVRHPLQTFAVYLLNAVVMFVVLGVWRRFVGATNNLWLVGLAGMLALTLQLLSRLAFMASAVALFQSKLAHAGYVAAPLPMWPDSPSAEALENLIDRKNS